MWCMNDKNIALIGSTGGIGQAFLERLGGDNRVFEFSRRSGLDYNSEHSIETAAQSVSDLDMILIATGFLHDDRVMPEKSMRDSGVEKFEKNFLINCIGPALVMKHFLPKLKRDERSVCAALSARVGSISDNGLGGWTAYRASKAALNMVIKNAAIETGRKNKKAIIVGLHPGTVETDLSAPFQGNVKEGKLFTPDYSAQKLLDVIDGLTQADTGKVFAWDGQEVPA